MDPRKGMSYLIQHGLVENNAESVAEFLFRGEGLGF